MAGANSFKYKLGIAVPSNRPDKLKRFLSSLQHMPKTMEICKLALVYQPPVDSSFEDYFDASKQIEAFDRTKPMPMLQLRRHSLDLVEDCEYICTVDCDFQFVSERPGKNYPMSSDDYYMSSIEWLDKNPDVGVLSQRGYFGGYAWGYEPQKNPNNGLIENNAGGIIMRNIGKEKIFPPECHGFVGVMSEPLMGFNILSHGYKLAKRFNCPNKFETPGSGKHVGGSCANLSYAEEVSNANAQGYIRKKFNDPLWRHSSKQYPRGLK